MLKGLWWQRPVGIGSTAALVLSLAFAHWGWSKRIDCPDCGSIKVLQAVVLVLWMLVPPIWFLLEYTFLFPTVYPEAKEDALNAFKYQQDLASKIWLAAVSALLILYFSKDLGR